MFENQREMKNTFKFILSIACIAGLSTLTSCSSSTESMNSPETNTQPKVEEKVFINGPIIVDNLSQVINLNTIPNHSIQHYNLPNKLTALVSRLSPNVYTLELFSPTDTKYKIVYGSEIIPITATSFGQSVTIKDTQSFRIERGY